MTWYSFRQNSNNGFFIGPAIYFIVEAENIEKACQIAQEYGLYWHLEAHDCSCCGLRWDEPEAHDALPAIDWKRERRHFRHFTCSNDCALGLIIPQGAPNKTIPL